jgi:hypothetical protein
VRESDWAIAGAEAKIKVNAKDRYFMMVKEWACRISTGQF